VSIRKTMKTMKSYNILLIATMMLYLSRIIITSEKKQIFIGILSVCEYTTRRQNMRESWLEKCMIINSLLRNGGIIQMENK
jgi:hypothetical protein